MNYTIVKLFVLRSQVFDFFLNFSIICFRTSGSYGISLSLLNFSECNVERLVHTVANSNERL